MSQPARIAVLASGGGRSFENLAELAASGELDVRIELVVSDRRDIGVLERAERWQVDRLVLPYREHRDTFSDEVFVELERRGVDLVVLAGFLRLLVVPAAWLGRVINIHPSLLPAFGGQGFYGDRVHRAVLERGVQFTGCTVHFVDNEYDQGPIILQRCVEVLPDDDVESLASRVFDQEKLALPEAIRRVLSGSVATPYGT